MSRSTLYRNWDGWTQTKTTTIPSEKNAQYTLAQQFERERIGIVQYVQYVQYVPRARAPMGVAGPFALWQGTVDEPTRNALRFLSDLH